MRVLCGRPLRSNGYLPGAHHVRRNAGRSGTWGSNIDASSVGQRGRNEDAERGRSPGCGRRAHYTARSGQSDGRGRDDRDSVHALQRAGALRVDRLSVVWGEQRKQLRLWSTPRAGLDVLSPLFATTLYLAATAEGGVLTREAPSRGVLSPAASAERDQPSRQCFDALFVDLDPDAGALGHCHVSVLHHELGRHHVPRPISLARGDVPGELEAGE